MLTSGHQATPEREDRPAHETHDLVPVTIVGVENEVPETAKPEATKLLTVEDRVGLDKFEFDEEPFITVDTDLCRTCDTKPCLYVCPSKVYRLEKGELVYNIEGCIELGACTIVCKYIGRNAIRWTYPRGSYGVEFRFG